MYSYLKDILQHLRKQDLEYLVDLFERDCPIRMKKAELVSELAVYLSSSPAEWLNLMPERDLMLLLRIREAGPEVHIKEYYPDYPSVLEYAGIVSAYPVDDPDAIYHEVWMCREVYRKVMPYLDDALLRGYSSGRFQAERKMLGFLNLYGLVPYDLLFDLMQDDMLTVSRSPLLKLCRGYGPDDELYFCSPCLDSIDEVLKERALFEEIKDYRPFLQKEVLEAGGGAPEFVFGLGTESGLALDTMLRNLGFEGADLAWEEHEIWMCAQDPERNLALFDALSRKGDSIASQEEYDRGVQIIADYANSLPKWRLFGYSADETGALRVYVDPSEEPAEGEPHWEMPHPSISEGYSDLIETTPELDALTAMMPPGFPFGMAIPHVAGDDPCPCGSGLKYKNCHGRNKS